jgi:hypothetical protein
VQASGVTGVDAVGSTGAGVQATSTTGTGLSARSTNGRGAELQSDNNQALWARITQANNTKDSIRAETPGSGAGINATSNNGVGGKFGGKTAQIHLTPSSAASHPTSGAAGDLFVDASKRLWFCKGGTNWHQLA